MKALKNLSISSIVSLITLIAVVISVIMYNVGVNAEGYFNTATISGAVGYSILAIVMLAIIIALPFVNINTKIQNIICDVLKIVVCVIIMYVLMQFIAGRIYGISMVYFVNSDVASTVQTAENLSSISLAITGIVWYAVSVVLAIAASFFTAKK